LSTEQFYDQFLPSAIESWLERESSVTYVPYLMGSRYSTEPLKAQLLGLTQQTTREEILAAMVRGLCEYQKAHLDEVGKNVPLKNVLHITGGATNPAIIRAKSKWMRDGQYVYDEQSSMKGAALLGLKYIENQGGPQTP
jgi:sugar (pentulose or hexulose) kinase